MNELNRIKWHESYEVGNLFVDSRHKVFLEILKNIEEVFLNNPKDSFLSPLLFSIPFAN